MAGPLSRTALIRLVLLAWLVAMAGSGAALLAAPEGAGVLRGLERMTGVLSWQLGASVLALVSWIAARPLPEGQGLRRLARVPGWICVGLLAVFCILAVRAMLAP